MAEARDIYQEVLDVLSRAILEGDSDTVLRLIPLPHAVRTMSGQIRIATEAEMISTVEGMQASLKGNGATDYIRIVDEAQFTGENEIVGEHTSHILRNGVRLVPPYRNQLTLPGPRTFTSRPSSALYATGLPENLRNSFQRARLYSSRAALGK